MLIQNLFQAKPTQFNLISQSQVSNCAVNQGERGAQRQHGLLASLIVLLLLFASDATSM